MNAPDKADGNYGPEPAFRFEAYGEGAVIVLLGEGIDERNYRRLSALAERLRAEAPRGFQELVPAYSSLLVVFDPLVSAPAEVLACLRSAAASLGPLAALSPARVVELPVAYGGDYGPDLAEAAAGAGLSEREYIALHAGRDYLIYMLGFSPGFPYLGGMDSRLARPRLKSPRAKVAGGSVGIADAQTGVYPQDSPGGWNIIGRTPLKLFDPCRERPALLEAGSYLRFLPITPERFSALHAGAQAEAKAEGSAMEGAQAPAGSELLVLKPGALSIIVDAGRLGYQASGVPPSGPMDEYSMDLATILAGNQRGEACIEVLLGGMELLFERPASFAVSGAAVPLFLDGVPVARNRALHAKAGSVLRMGTAEEGLRAYVAIRGGFSLPAVMGSRSTFMRGGFGGLSGRALAAGDRLAFAAFSGPVSAPPFLAANAEGAAYAESIIATKSELVLRALPGLESDRFSEEGLRRFYNEAYRLSPKSDRMGCRLEGPAVEHSHGADIVSSGVQTGTVQVPGDGQPIVLMADRQTTGGYTRIAQVIKADLPLLGQARPGQLVRFNKVSVEEAITALRQREALLRSSSGAPAPRQEGNAKQYRVTVDGKAFEISVEELP
ncbi:MAG TPA: urea amidolyase [Spirochaetaceae bacterium]|jgi:KipI family sensor histidine kinase inhibitor|nr:urea amidolyase [Spirochaetaceae bacterium]